MEGGDPRESSGGKGRVGKVEKAKEGRWEPLPGAAVYDGGMDLFGELLSVEGEGEGRTAKVKYGWPWDPEAEPSVVPLSRLVPAWEGRG